MGNEGQVLNHESLTWPNNPVERTGDSVCFLAVRHALPCRPPLTAGVMLLDHVCNAIRLRKWAVRPFDGSR